MYVALISVTRIDNLFMFFFIITFYTPNVFRVNEYANYVDFNSLTVSLLNTRSLDRHASDISRARKLTDDDILCLTERQITNDTDKTDMLGQLNTFKIYFNSCGVRH